MLCRGAPSSEVVVFHEQNVRVFRLQLENQKTKVLIKQLHKVSWTPHTVYSHLTLAMRF